MDNLANAKNRGKGEIDGETYRRITNYNYLPKLLDLSTIS